eukprot:1151406-Pelagomonas_calceolata.AAC.7
MTFLWIRSMPKIMYIMHIRHGSACAQEGKGKLNMSLQQMSRNGVYHYFSFNTLNYASKALTYYGFKFK